MDSTLLARSYFPRLDRRATRPASNGCWSPLVLNGKGGERMRSRLRTWLRYGALLAGAYALAYAAMAGRTWS